MTRSLNRKPVKTVGSWFNSSPHDPDSDAHKTMNITSQEFNVGEILDTPGHVAERLYEIVGIHYGAEGQESVIELVAIDAATATAHSKAQHMFVPVEMIEAGLTAGIFQKTQP